LVCDEGLFHREAQELGDLTDTPFHRSPEFNFAILVQRLMRRRGIG
jgi:hypothetical protein